MFHSSPPQGICLSFTIHTHPFSDKVQMGTPMSLVCLSVCCWSPRLVCCVWTTSQTRTWPWVTHPSTWGIGDNWGHDTHTLTNKYYILSQLSKWCQFRLFGRNRYISFFHLPCHFDEIGGVWAKVQMGTWQNVPICHFLARLVGEKLKIGSS